MTDGFFKWLNLPPWLLLSVALTGFVFLGLPASALEFLRLKDFRDVPVYGGIVGALSLASLVLGVVKAIRDGLERRGVRVMREEARAAALGRLDTLTPEETAIVAYCLMTNQRTVYLKATDRGGNGLVAKRLAIRSPGSILELPHTLQDFVWEHLNSSPLGEHLVEDALQSPLVAPYVDALRVEEDRRRLWAGV